jgi:hypothetical protein
MRTTQGAIGLLLSVALGMAAFGCSDTAGVEAWAGTYQTAMKFNGPDDVWQASSDLVIAPDSSVSLGGIRLMGAVFANDTLAWEVAGGNSSTGLVVFKDSDERGYYWIAPVGPCFTGWIQYPGDDPLDFRGLKL